VGEGGGKGGSGDGESGEGEGSTRGEVEGGGEKGRGERKGKVSCRRVRGGVDGCENSMECGRGGILVVDVWEIWV